MKRKLSAKENIVNAQNQNFNVQMENVFQVDGDAVRFLLIKLSIF